MRRLQPMAVRRGDHHHTCARSFARGDARRGVLEHQTVFDRMAKALRRQQEAVRRRLAALDVLGCDQHRRDGQAGRRQPHLGQFARRGGDDGPAIGGQGGQERSRAFDGLDPACVGDLALHQPLDLGRLVDAGDVEAAHRFDRPPAVDAFQHRLDVQPVPARPGPPDPLAGDDRGQDRAVHVEQEGGELAIGKQQGFGHATLRIRGNDARSSVLESAVSRGMRPL